MSKQIILFDIDQTLINTKLLKEKMRKDFALAIKTSKKKLSFVEGQYVKSLKHPHDFKPEGFLFFLNKNLGADLEKLKIIYLKRGKNYQASLYPETKLVLKKLSKKYLLGIYSEGWLEFQSLKISFSKIEKYFKKNLRYIYRRKLKSKIIKLLPPQSIIVDNNKEVLEKISERKNLRPIWLNRKGQTKHKFIPTITNLKQLEKAIED